MADTALTFASRAEQDLNTGYFVELDVNIPSYTVLFMFNT